MLCIFDEAAAREGVVRLFADGLASLARQWLVRWAVRQLLGQMRHVRAEPLRDGSVHDAAVEPAELPA